MNISLYTDRGVVIPCPDSVEIDENIPPDDIAPGVVIHAGSRIRGDRTSIGPGCVLGAEAPATVENCQLGREVHLKGGYFSFATFLDQSEMGSGAHVRAGTLLEEQSRTAHTVGLKQTILLPYVTAGSLINFCDCLMAGGTGRGNHSEIGSSYIHFNFTARQDKATPSLIGDVPRGVMLDRPPIFLGGQGGLVGPARIAYGTILPAGTVCREDILEENMLFSPASPGNGGLRAFNPSLYFGIERTVRNNLIYIGNLQALRAWYQEVRIRYMASDRYAQACHAGALIRIDSAIRERIRQMEVFSGKLSRSIEIAHSVDGFPEDCRRQQQTFVQQWPALKETLKQGAPEKAGEEKRAVFLKEWRALDGTISYLEAVARLSPASRAAGAGWLQAVVDHYLSRWNV